MTQNPNLKLIEVVRSGLIHEDNDMICFDIKVDGKELVKINRFEINFLKTNKRIRWWKLCKTGMDTIALNCEIQDFKRICSHPRNGEAIQNGNCNGNFIVLDFNESNYLKFHIADEKYLRMELVNFLAPYPVVQDTKSFSIELE